MKWTILGAGSCQFDTDYAPSSHHVQTNQMSVLVDAGPGVTGRLLQNAINPHLLDAVLISHEHVDHSAGLIDLFQALYVRTKYHPELPGTRPAGSSLTVVGFTGLKKWVEIAEDWAWNESGVLPIEVIELGHGDTWEEGELRVQALHVPHTEHSLGFRMEVGGNTVAYTGDTSTDPVLDDVMQKADLVIANTAMPPSDDPKQTRLDPRSAARHAANAQANDLALVHFYPELIEQRDQIESWVREAGFEGEIHIGKDGLSIELGA